MHKTHVAVFSLMRRRKVRRRKPAQSTFQLRLGTHVGCEDRKPWFLYSREKILSPLAKDFHFVFRLQLAGTNLLLDRSCESTIIDLAGSERLDESNCTSEQLDGVCAINLSLCTLGQVIMAISNKKKVWGYFHFY